MNNLMIIQDEDFLNNLIVKKILRPVNNNKYVLTIDNENIELYVSLNDYKKELQKELDKSFKEIETKKTNKYSSSEIKKKYEEFVSSFPTTDKHSNHSKTRNLKTDSGKKGLSRFTEIVNKYDIDPDSIIKAMNYEVEWRKKASLNSKDNKLTFMKGMAAWLNDVVNIKTQIEELENNDKEQGSNKTNISMYNDI
jgi:hypothetical protein